MEVREQFAIPEARLPEAVKALTCCAGVEEGMIVSTCNRVEILARTTDDHAGLDEFFHEFYGIDPELYRKHLYEYHERDAVRHVFRVASSLDSMVVGEPQILGQVKEAYATARAVGAVNSQLDALLNPGLRGRQASAQRNRSRDICRLGRFGRGGSGEEDLRESARQEYLPRRRGQDVGTGGASSAGPWRREDLRFESHLRSRSGTGEEVQW